MGGLQLSPSYLLTFQNQIPLNDESLRKRFLEEVRDRVTVDMSDGYGTRDRGGLKILCSVVLEEEEEEDRRRKKMQGKKRKGKNQKQKLSIMNVQPVVAVARRKKEKKKKKRKFVPPPFSSLTTASHTLKLLDYQRRTSHITTRSFNALSDLRYYDGQSSYVSILKEASVQKEKRNYSINRHGSNVEYAQLIQKLSRVDKVWARREFFYGSTELNFFKRKPEERKEWIGTRREINERRPKKMRRFGKTMIKEEISALQESRRSQSDKIKVGAIVTALNFKRDVLHRGSVLTSTNDGALIQFERKNLAVQDTPLQFVAMHSVPGVVDNAGGGDQLSGNGEGWDGMDLGCWKVEGWEVRKALGGEATKTIGDLGKEERAEVKARVDRVCECESLVTVAETITELHELKSHVLNGLLVTQGKGPHGLWLKEFLTVVNEGLVKCEGVLRSGYGGLFERGWRELNEEEGRGMVKSILESGIRSKLGKRTDALLEARISGELNSCAQKSDKQNEYFDECNALLGLLEGMREEVYGGGLEVEAIMENLRPRQGEGGGEVEEDLWWDLGRAVKEYVAEVGLREVVRGY
ncbi:hypothetical protein TL16_g11407 [Triparma laevis f. inornata]|uniref:Uncharacterized protein n=2 Tax=Triparma laevis TaxID=1534972 RepID=A0A9W7DRI3_9STRA|nr:hypothetical protein TrLO_g2534 [Triparma laevis f. longispina]GMH89271.1 hypothetical protein TL16_g11407 [Triparma laevis f. inornata]